MSALAKESESVLIDLISYKDLEIMKMKKMQQNSLNMSNNMNESMNNMNSMSDPNKINKKYFIMSYANEFEKVHYPLPLQYMSTPDTEMMLRTIERMRKYINSNLNTKNSSQTTFNIKDIK
jgi:coiled-coil domain-containing protein 61